MNCNSIHKYCVTWTNYPKTNRSAKLNRVCQQSNQLPVKLATIVNLSPEDNLCVLGFLQLNLFILAHPTSAASPRCYQLCCAVYSNKCQNRPWRVTTSHITACYQLRGDKSNLQISPLLKPVIISDHWGPKVHTSFREEGTTCHHVQEQAFSASGIFSPFTLVIQHRIPLQINCTLRSKLGLRPINKQAKLMKLKRDVIGTGG